MKLFKHSRLVFFFVSLAAAGTLFGLWRSARIEARRRAELTELVRAGDTQRARELERVLTEVRGDYVVAISTAVLATTLLGFAAVFFHRVHISGIRWRETEAYLARIRRESAKYRALMEGAADMLLIVDPRTHAVRECNAVAREKLGLAAGATPAARLESILFEKDVAAFQSGLERAGAAAGPFVSLHDIRVRGGDGTLFSTDARIAGIELEDDRVIQVSLRDLTQQKEMERQLAIRDRLSSIGLVTAGVAHEINNPLEGIGNYLSLLEREGLSEDARTRYIGLVRHGFTLIRDIVRDLLSFARPAAGRGDADLAEVVDRALKLATFSERFRDVKIELSGLHAPLRVVGDPGRLEQVVFNLLLNAATAMKSKGSIRIDAVRAAAADGEPRAVELSVSDTGPGIAPADIDKIFDPFFSSTQGTGLGLAVSYGIVRAHGGSISVRNIESGGARFTIRLPWPGESEPAPGADGDRDAGRAPSRGTRA